MASTSPLIAMSLASSTTIGSLSPDQFLGVLDIELPFLLIANSMGSVLLAMLFALFFFANSSMRRQPIFILNVLTIALGITHALLWICYQVRLIGQGIIFQPQILLTLTILSSVTPITVDCILFLRLWAVFPRHHTPRKTWYIVIGIPILIKVARLATLSYDINLAVQHIGDSPPPLPVADRKASFFPYIQLEWIAKLVDDLFCSGPFLWRLYKDGIFAERVPFTSRLQQLFWISTYNFVFPVLLSIVQLVLCTASDNYWIALCLAQANLYLTVVGLVFATVWAAECRWEDAQGKGMEMPVDRIPHWSTSKICPLDLSSGV